ncbi:EthD domain-containing protein [Hypoxylon trugodes]|uniref:EthD domain-containing protein n=1 Tax=Hypoxylon trugodes TaxID=326681 RepID=UPI002194887F|nr:EthD domain-containing protein [Hypoxylon trugodes]KAI1382813.1 EthD domain-containing protein [Hypoxylon trugodes]
MTFSMLIYLSRKAGTTPEQFKAHYDNKHVPLIKEVAGSTFPLTHTRYYIRRSEGQAEGTTRNATTPAQVFLGTQSDFDVDAVVILTFTDEAAFQEFFQITHSPENAAKVVADEELFLDRTQTRAVALGSTEVTQKD